MVGCKCKSNKTKQNAHNAAIVVIVKVIETISLAAQRSTTNANNEQHAKSTLLQSVFFLFSHILYGLGLSTIIE